MSSLKKVCAWCGDGQDRVRPGDKITHGICPPCASELDVQDNLPEDGMSVNGWVIPSTELWDEAPKRRS